MARQTVTTTTKTRVKKNGTTNGQGYQICKNCGGDGVVKVRKKK